MPANLTYRYINAEKAYRRAGTPREILDCLQIMLRELPKHKGTDKLQADLKRKISQAKIAVETGHSGRGNSKTGGFRIPAAGSAQVVLIGPPNAGKSLLLSTVTSAEPEIADFPFTTRTPAPGLMTWQEYPVQLIDTPPISNDYFPEETRSLIRGCDLVLLLVDLSNDDGLDELQTLLDLTQNSKTRLGHRTEMDPDNVGLTWTQTLMLFTHADDEAAEIRREYFCEPEFRNRLEFEIFEPALNLLDSADVEKLQEAIVHRLDLVRVYTKDPRRKEPDLTKPYVVKRQTPIIDVARMIHDDLARNFHSARVWGEGIHDATPVQASYEVADGNIIEITTR